MEMWIWFLIIAILLDVSLFFIFYKYYPKIQMWLYGMVIKTVGNIHDIKEAVKKR